MVLKITIGSFKFVSSEKQITFFCLKKVSVSSGERLDGLGSEAAAQKLRGNAGTTVTVKVALSNISTIYVSGIEFSTFISQNSLSFPS